MAAARRRSSTPGWQALPLLALLLAGLLHLLLLVKLAPVRLFERAPPGDEAITIEIVPDRPRETPPLLPSPEIATPPPVVAGIVPQPTASASLPPGEAEMVGRPEPGTTLLPPPPSALQAAPPATVSLPEPTAPSPAATLAGTSPEPGVAASLGQAPAATTLLDAPVPPALAAVPVAALKEAAVLGIVPPAANVTAATTDPPVAAAVAAVTDARLAVPPDQAQVPANSPASSAETLAAPTPLAGPGAPIAAARPPEPAATGTGGPPDIVASVPLTPGTALPSIVAAGRSAPPPDAIPEASGAETLAALPPQLAGSDLVPEALGAPPSPPPAILPAALLGAAEIREQLRDALQRLPCSRLEVAVDDDLGVRISGRVAGPDDRRLLAQVVAESAPASPPRLDVAVVEPPFCAALDLLERVEGDGPPPRTGLNHADGSYRDGDYLVVTIDVPPDAGGYLNVVYLDQGDAVVHLFPAPGQPGDRVAAGQQIRLGAEASERRPDRRDYRVSPPYGSGMILAVLTPQPLPHLAAREIEPMSSFLDGLAAALAGLAPGFLRIGRVDLSTQR